MTTAGTSGSRKSIRLYCFPFAGGSCSQLYGDWKENETLSQVGIDFQYRYEIPGRINKRVEEEPIEDAELLANQIFLEIRNETKVFDDNDCQIVLFGHSFGAIIAFEVARRLETVGRSPLAVFVSAMNPPSHLPLTQSRVSQMDDTNEIIEYFARNGFQLSKEILKDEEFKSLFLRTIRADYAVLENYKPPPHENLMISSPLFVLGGRKDAIIKSQNVVQWVQHTTGPFSTHIYDNQGHYYVKDPSILNDIASRIAQAVKELTTIQITNGSSSSPNHEFGSRFGTPHPSLQEFQAIQYENDNLNGLNANNIQTWFPKDDKPAFHTAKEDGTYHTLSYKNLDNAIDACPTWKKIDQDIFVVAVLLPMEWMTEMALTQLCIMAGRGKRGRMEQHAYTASHPIDARMNRETIIQALNQLQVRGIVSTKELLDKYCLLVSEEKESEEAKEAINRLVDVRVVTQLGGGLVSWEILKESEQNHTSTDGTLPVEEPNVINDKEDEKPILLLRTSGTTALPKIVPLTARAILYNAQCQGRAMELIRNDCTLNAMPLFHIGGLSCSFFSVLVSGSSTIFSGPFEGDRFLGQIVDRYNTGIYPTWYNAVPTLHTALVLHVNAIGNSAKMEAKRNNLRFVRSGAAQLTNNTRESIRDILQTKVINSFALSECMPVCVQTMQMPEDEAIEKGTVGLPVGPSLRIADENGLPLPYGEEGEICIKGIGVIPSYLGIPVELTHTNDEYLKTGDMGTMDSLGRVFLSGRSKDMIKRGGEQIWPAQVDEIIQDVDGVDVCVTFGVPNKLWGEEVCSAVVLNQTARGSEDILRETIFEACRTHLDSISVPTQIVFIEASELVKGPSGKYIRRKFCEALGVKAKDVVTLRYLQGNDQISETDTMLCASDKEDYSHRVVLSDAMNGVRILVSLFVVMNHVGFYPNLAWEKIQSYNINIPIFFILGAFHLTTTVSGNVRWSNFVGTRIGALNALFVITQLIALPAFLLLSCAADGQECDAEFLKKNIFLWFFATLTGMVGIENAVNRPTWYITVFYQFIMIFPFLYRWTKPLSQQFHAGLLIAFLPLATTVFWLLSIVGVEHPMLWKTRVYLVAWIPLLISAMMAAYFLVRYSPSTRTPNQLKAWGILTDVLSLLLFAFVVIAGTSPDCLWLDESTTLALRPDEPLPEETRDGFGSFTQAFQYYVCDITWDEFEELHETGITGRFPTTIAIYIGKLRMGSAIVLLWLYGLAHGHGHTAKLLSTKPFVSISTLTYHLYLLHMPVSRYYIMATRGLDHPEFWWDLIPMYPVPVLWYEFFFIVGISLGLGAIIEKFVTPLVQPYTIAAGVWTCNKVSNFVHFLQNGPTSPSRTKQDGLLLHPKSDENDWIDTRTYLSNRAATLKEGILLHIEGLTGNSNVTSSTHLRDLGLDSLGTTALLSSLKAGTIPQAKNLTLVDLVKCETVGDLIQLLSLDPTHKQGEIDEEIGVSS